MSEAAKQENIQELVKTQKRKIKEQEKEIQQLREALQKANGNSTSIRGLDRKIKQEDRVVIIEDDDDEENHDQEMAPLKPDVVGQPIWSGEGDGIYRCSECNWEIAERFCEGCGMDYREWVCEETPDSIPIDANLLDNFHQKRHQDQQEYRLSGPPRATTPLRDIDLARLRPDTIAYDYEDRVEEYRELLARGATRMMCETFYLSYMQDTGIWFEMTDDLVQEWAGPEMLKVDPDSGVGFVSWKVCLGREIVLDEDDTDGSRYVDECLEEALLFGSRVYCAGRSAGVEDHTSSSWGVAYQALPPRMGGRVDQDRTSREKRL
ncbi:hypothetical protein VNI00_014980 [Paramarasmius palmivorus]|uniref:DUF8191 domain-containing protein n=1 Tax=Paramarasmius palmivorus TaxID=297713 RepID=A0AAW0BMX4_9AGAR